MVDITLRTPQRDVYIGKVQPGRRDVPATDMRDVQRCFPHQIPEAIPKASPLSSRPDHLSPGAKLLLGRCIFITGAASGIGPGTAGPCASHGAKLALMDHDAAPLDAIAQATGTFQCMFDLANIAEAILFLTREDASYITGTALAIDGGRTYH